jgi:hypothetical protein
MKAKNIKNGKIVEVWIVSHENDQPEWVKKEFYTGYMGWIDDKSIRYGLVHIRSNASRLSLGDIFIYNGKSIDFMSAEKFLKKYKIISK